MRGKITLRSHEVEDLPPLEVDVELIRDTRERMHVSRAVVARRLGSWAAWTGGPASQRNLRLSIKQ